jgi:hypothetical protein
MLRECGRDGLRPAGGDRSNKNLAWARRTGKRRGKAPNRNC